MATPSSPTAASPAAPGQEPASADRLARVASPTPTSARRATSRPKLTPGETDISVGAWELIKYSTDSIVPSARSMHTAVPWGDKMYIFGGFTGSERTNQLYEYSTTDNTWTQLNGARGTVPRARDRHAATVAGNAMYIFGGHDGASRLGDTHCYDFLSGRWTQVAGPGPTPRHSHTLATMTGPGPISERIFMFGGYDGNYRADVWTLTVATHRWQKCTTSGHGPSPRYRSSLVVCNDMLVVFGGHDGTRHLEDVYLLDPETFCWTKVITSGLTPIPRDSHGCVTYGDSIIVFGGSSGSAMNDVHALNLPTATWVPLFPSGAPPHPRFCHSTVLCGASRVVVFGGFDGVTRRNDMFQLDVNVGRLGVRVTVPESSLRPHLGHMVNDPAHADAWFKVDNSVLFGHKVLLSRFPALLELSASSTLQQPAVVQDMAVGTFTSVLKFAYTDDCPEFAGDGLVLMFEAAERFQMDRLKALCQNAMLDVLCVENAASFFAKADKHRAAHMRALAFNYILAHFDEVSVTPGFEDMGRTRIDLVFELLKRRGAINLAQ